MQVLLIEDETPIADMLTGILSRDGFSVTRAADVPAGLDLARSLRPQLIISDVVLPGGNGIDLCSQIAREFPSCSFLLMSGSSAFRDLVQLAADRGLAAPMIRKPFAISDFRSAVRAAATAAHASQPLASGF